MQVFRTCYVWFREQSGSITVIPFSLYLSFSFFQKYLLMLFSYLMYQNISTCENICTVPLLRYVIIKSRSTSLKIQFLAVEARLPLSPRMKQLFLFLCI